MDSKLDDNQNFNLFKKTELNYCENMITKHFSQSLSSNQMFNFNKSNCLEENYLPKTNSLQNKSNNQNNNQNIKEFISNQDQKIQKLITDCELINNNNINNFVLDYCGQTNQNLNLISQQNNQSVLKSLNYDSSKQCTCKCHCKKKKIFDNLTKSNKFFNSLSKLKKSTSQKLNEIKAKNKFNDISNIYEAFSPSSLSNCSFSSSSSVSSHTLNSSTCSSLQENTYNLSNSLNVHPIILTKPIRKPPALPEKTLFRAPAVLPSENTESLSGLSIKPLKTEDIYEDGYVLIKSTENLNELIKKGDDLDTKNILSEIYNEEKLKEESDSNSFKDDESLYATIDNNESDYGSIKNEEIDKIQNNIKLLKNTEQKYYQEDEDLYQDICVNESTEDIYESLPNDLCNLHFNETKNNNENFYTNNETINELDRKLMRKQKILDKKRMIKLEKLSRKFNITGKEVPLNAGIVKENVKGNYLDLNINKGEVVLILRIDGNPPGKWLAKNERGKFGYVDLNLIDVDPESIKSLMNVPNLLTSGFA